MGSDTRERLVATARDLVHAASYADVSVDDVCRAAGVNKGSLYHFFPSKNALGVAVLERNWELMSGLLDDAFAAPVPPLERIDRFVTSFTGMMVAMREHLGATPGCPLGNLAAEFSAQDGEMRGRVRHVMDAYTGHVVGAVTEAQIRGDVRTGLDPRVAARSVVALIQGFAVLAKTEDDPAVLGDLTAAIRLLLPAP